MISVIEDNIEKEYSQICTIISKELTINQRATLEIFKFISGYTFADYVGLRRLERAFALKKETNDSWANITFELGEEYTSYYRRFKKKFNVSPDDAIRGNLELDFVPPLFFEKLEFQNVASEIDLPEASTAVLNEPMQITVTQYELFEEIQSLQAMFGFDNQEMIEIYNYSIKYGLSMEDLCKCLQIEKIEEDEFFDGKAFLMECAVRNTAKMVQKYALDCVSVYSWISDGYSCEEVYLIMVYDVPAEDASTFVYKMNNDRLKLENIHADAIKLYFTYGDYDCIFGDLLSVKNCMDLVEKAKIRGIDIFELPDVLLGIVEVEPDMEIAINEYFLELEEWDRITDPCTASYYDYDLYD